MRRGSDQQAAGSGSASAAFSHSTRFPPISREGIDGPVASADVKLHDQFTAIVRRKTICPPDGANVSGEHRSGHIRSGGTTKVLHRLAVRSSHDPKVEVKSRSQDKIGRKPAE